MGITILNKQKRSGTVTVLSVTGVLLSLLTFASADEPSVLNPSDHPKSPQYQSLFPSEFVPLDSRLSWTERFNGDENFNSTQVLDQTTAVSLEPTTRMKERESESTTGSGMDAIGIVKSIKQNQGKIKIAHGPIDKFGMPAMTMVFKVEDPGLLAKIEKSQEIGFDIENRSAGFVITRLMPTEQMKSTANTQAMDARGVVRAVRMSQGKVKIKHGPIEKYGMPGMTMMFKVEKPELLQGIRKDTQVEFDIDNSSGGFVITNIAPAGDLEESHDSE